tara:strand:- start:986 stop:2011 length:1026 start_codon:yes stop_codon:yes gene_type:complete
MLNIEEIVKTLKEDQAQSIANSLGQNCSYSDVSLEIFKCYREGKSATETANELELDFNAFVIFERIIYRCILNYYGEVDKDYKDLLLTSVFYAVYGSQQKEKREKIQELEDLFHKMKQYQIEEASDFLLAEIYELQKGSPLEAVYAHLKQKYSNQASENTKLIEAFKALNSKLSSSTKTSTKTLIANYRLIRNLVNDNPNRISRAILQLARLSLVIVADQVQLLKEDNINKEELLSTCKSSVNEIYFGFLRFYLKNILEQIEVIFLLQNDKLKYGSRKLQEISSERLEAYNLAFDSCILERFNKKAKENKLNIPYFNLLPTKFNPIHLESIYFGENRFSCS